MCWRPVGGLKQILHVLLGQLLASVVLHAEIAILSSAARRWRDQGFSCALGAGLTFGNMDRRFRMRADVCSGVGIDVLGPAASPAGAAVAGFRRISISCATIVATSTQLAISTGTGRSSDCNSPLLYMTARRRV